MIVAIEISPEYVISAEEGAIGLEEIASKIAGLLFVTTTPFRDILTLLDTEHSRVTANSSAGYECCCGPVLD